MQDIFNIFKSITVQEIIILLIFMCPSTALMFYFVLKFLDKKIIWQKILISGLIFGSLNLIFRKVYVYYKLPMGSSTLIIAFLFLLTVIIYHNISFVRATIGSLVCYSLLFAGTPIVIKVITATNIPIEQILSSSLLNTVFGYTEDVFLIIGALIVTFTKFNINKIIRY